MLNKDNISGVTQSKDGGVTDTALTLLLHVIIVITLSFINFVLTLTYRSVATLFDLYNINVIQLFPEKIR